MPASELSDDVLVLNPVFGKPIGPFGSRPVTPDRSWFHKLENENGFYSRLEASILREGIRNPIFCQSIDEGTFCRYGTSRLWIAKRHGMEIACVIADYVGRWNRLEELRGADDIESKFIDAPGVIEILPETMRIDACPHVHLKP